MTAGHLPEKKTIADWLAEPEERRLELIDGDLIEKAAPDVRHSTGQAGLDRILGPVFARRGGGGFPGGWWIHIEVDLQLGANGYRPDLAGWRRERVSLMPLVRPVTLRPDWICEVLSETNASNDKIRKLRRPAEPFDAIELRVGLLFGDDPDD